jgi:hypothetical protein
MVQGPLHAANWTMALALNLVPAAWTVTDGNITGIACDFSAGAITSYFQCETRLGHNRGGCDGRINGTDQWHRRVHVQHVQRLGRFLHRRKLHVRHGGRLFHPHAGAQPEPRVV